MNDQSYHSPELSIYMSSQPNFVPARSIDVCRDSRMELVKLVLSHFMLLL